jgi:flagellar biosynthesis/type III secretory pathway protein FliH
MARREAEHFERGLAQGREEGARETREAMAQEVAAQCALLSQVTQEVQALVADPKQFFEPLKRLSLHLAEQLVLGELSTSSKAIERLVQHCLDEVSHPLQQGVVVELNPEDKKRLQAQGGDFLEGLRLEALAELKPGSVRVFANDMVVEDLVAHRLQALAHGLLIDVPSWQNNSALASTLVDTHSTEHDDDLA